MGENSRLTAVLNGEFAAETDRICTEPEITGGPCVTISGVSISESLRINRASTVKNRAIAIFYY